MAGFSTYRVYLNPTGDALTEAEIETVQAISALENPGADRILFWDHSALAWAMLEVGSGLSITDTTLSASGGANTALSNLASVAINTTLVSDTDNTDALGTAAIGWSDLFLGSGAVITFSTAPSTADVTITHSANTLTIAGGDLIMATSLGSTGTRVLKGWFTDLEVTNAIAGDITGNAATVTGFTPASGSLTLSGADALTLTTTAATNVTLPTSGTLMANLSEDTTPQLGGDLDTNGSDINLAEDDSIDYDSSMAADENWTGIAIDGTAGATISVGDLIYLDATATEWLLADASAVGTAGTVVLGICILASTDGNPTKILLNGTIRSAAFPGSIALGAPVYASETAGDITATAPTTADAVVRVLGWTITAEPNTIYFNPSPSHITVTG